MGDDDSRSKPVHPVLTKRVRPVGGHHHTPFERVTKPVTDKLPKKVEEKLTPARPDLPYKKVMQRAARQREQVIVKTKLRVIHSNVDSLVESEREVDPPCDSCVTKPCCSKFIVTLTKEEYDSGLYGDFAIKITEEQMHQLRSSTLSWAVSAMLPFNKPVDGNYYFLEGTTEQACPYLQENGDCGIYQNRPITCRVYSCVEDDRITPEMRAGDTE